MKPEVLDGLGAVPPAGQADAPGVEMDVALPDFRASTGEATLIEAHLLAGQFSLDGERGLSQRHRDSDSAATGHIRSVRTRNAERRRLGEPEGRDGEQRYDRDHPSLYAAQARRGPIARGGSVSSGAIPGYVRSGGSWLFDRPTEAATG